MGMERAARSGAVAVSLVKSKKSVEKRTSTGCKHSWVYLGGAAKCQKCGRYLQPDGRVTKTPTGRRRKAK